LGRKEKSAKEEKEREARGEHEVNLSQKELRVVPSFLYKSRKAQIRLNSLQLLNISNNKLVALPESGCFFHCASLKKLNLSHNRLQKLPEELAECTELLIFDMQNNDITELPEIFVSACVKLRKLNMAENEMIQFPENIGKLVSWNKLLVLFPLSLSFFALVWKIARLSLTCSPPRSRPLLCFFVSFFVSHALPFRHCWNLSWRFEISWKVYLSHLVI
jgi:hypothetical protein